MSKKNADARQPWLKWYPSDWRADPKLRMCSLAARGLWIEMIGFMHEADPYGFLVIAGVSPTVEQIAALAGVAVMTARKALSELETAGVFSRDGKGVIYSRRMVRDKAKAENDRRNGKGGGNPNLLQPDNGGVNPEVKAQRPEARDQKPESERSDAVASEPAAPARPVDLNKQFWDTALAFLTKMGIAEAKARPLVGRWRKDHGNEAVIAALAKAEAETPAEIIPFIVACLRSGHGKRRDDTRETVDDNIARGRAVMAESYLARTGMDGGARRTGRRTGDRDRGPETGRDVATGDARGGDGAARGAADLLRDAAPMDQDGDGRLRTGIREVSGLGDYGRDPDLLSASRIFPESGGDGEGDTGPIPRNEPGSTDAQDGLSARETELLTIPDFLRRPAA